jgi:predicted chitinase
MVAPLVVGAAAVGAVAVRVIGLRRAAQLAARAAQYLLVSYGIDVAVDGIWGKLTSSAFGKARAPEKAAIEEAVKKEGVTVDFLETTADRNGEITNIEVAMMTTEVDGIDNDSRSVLLAIANCESGFQPRDENHVYTPQRARQIFGACKGMKDAEISGLVARGPDAFFEHVYGPGSEKGIELGNISIGDGAKYRGRGVLQLTGRSMYEAFQRDTGVMVLDRPEILNQENYALMSTFWYWKKFVVSRGADRSVSAAMRVVNPGLVHVSGELAKRKKLANLYSKVLA